MSEGADPREEDMVCAVVPIPVAALSIAFSGTGTTGKLQENQEVADMAYGIAVQMILATETGTDSDFNGLTDRGLGGYFEERGELRVNPETGARVAYWGRDMVEKAPIYMMTFPSFDSMVRFLGLIAKDLGPIVIGGPEHSSFASSDAAIRIDAVESEEAVRAMGDRDSQLFFAVDGQILDNERLSAALPALLASNLEDEMAEFDDDWTDQEVTVEPDSIPDVGDLPNQLPAYGYEVIVGSKAKTEDEMLETIMTVFGVKRAIKSVFENGGWTVDFDAETLNVAVSYPANAFAVPGTERYPHQVSMTISLEADINDAFPKGLQGWATHFGLSTVNKFSYDALDGSVEGFALQDDGSLTTIQQRITEDDCED